MLGMPDAAMVDQMATKEQVPDNMMVLWLASKGLPVTFASLVGRYRKLQEAANNPATGAQMPRTTVAEDVNSGLASLQQNAVPPMPELTQLQDQPQPQPQPQAAPQPQMPPMAPMPPDQGQGPAGLASLDPGAMGQGMAGGGIIAFANGQEVAQQQDQQNQEEALFNQLTPAEAPAPTPTPAPQQQQTYKAPTSLDQVFQQYGESMEDLDAAFDAQIAKINELEIYQPKNDPSYDQERERLIAQKLADQNDMKQDQWDALIAQGQAIMEEASKPHEPGFSSMASMAAGTKAYINKLAALEKEHKALQEKLDKDIIQQNHLEYLAQETNSKAAIDARNAIKKEIIATQEKKIEVMGSKQYNYAQLGISAINARTNMVNKPTDYQRKLDIEYAALKEENAKLPPGQQKSDAELRKQASQSVSINDVAADANSIRIQNMQMEAMQKAQEQVAAAAKSPLSPLFRALNGKTDEEKQQIMQTEVQRIYQQLMSAGQSSSSSSAPRVNLADLPQ